MNNKEIDTEFSTIIWAVSQKKVGERVGVFVFPDDRWKFLSLCFC